MNLDKANWRKVKLGDVAFEYSKRIDNPSESGFDRFVGSANIGRFDFRVRSWESTSDVESTMKQFGKDDYLLVRRSLYASDFRERAPRADFDGICSGDILTIRENPEFIAEGFLIGVLNSEKLWQYIVANASGSITRRIKWKELAQYEFLLPPKEQQTKLAELFWASQEELETKERLLASVNGLLKAYQKSAFAEVNESTRIKNVAKLYSGSTPLRSEHEKYFANGKIPWIKTLDLNNGPLLKSEELITETALKETSCKIMPKGTVLVAMYGGFNQIGRTGLLEIDASTNQAVCSICCDEKVLLPKYLLFCLNARVDYWKKVAISSRKDPNITKGDVENFPLNIPPIENQKQIVDKIESIRVQLTSINQAMDSAKKISLKMINQIFS